MLPIRLRRLAIPFFGAALPVGRFRETLRRPGGGSSASRCDPKNRAERRRGGRL